MKELRQFNGDIATRDAVIDYIRDFIDTEGLEKMYAKKDVSHIADATDLITKAFEQLEIEYGIKDKQEEPKNASR